MQTPPPVSDAIYSPARRTALVLLGTGTAGAYHAGALKALVEAGIRLDLVAGRGIGAVSTFFAAADAGVRLWDEDGLWGGSAPAGLYGVRTLWRVLGLSLAALGLALVLPLWLTVAAVVAYPAVLVVQVVAPAAGTAVSAMYRDLLAALFSPGVLASVIPRVATLAALAAGLIVAGAWAVQAVTRRSRRRVRGAIWWRAVGTPIDAAGAVRWATAGFWRFIRGATTIAEPPPAEFGRRFAELVTENLGQPGYREMIVTAHDLDARRDVVFALLAEPFRSTFATAGEDTPRAGRESELIDLAGAGRALAIDALAGALSVPNICEPHRITFSADGPWRGETHRLCDRPGAVARLFGEVAAAGATQVIVVSPATGVDGPHALSPARLGLRARVGETISSCEAAALDEAIAAMGHRFWGVYRIAPVHNPLGPFDVTGGYDDRSDRRCPLRELVTRGYQDAYRQFIDPVVGASGESMRTATVVPDASPDDLPLQPGTGSTA